MSSNIHSPNIVVWWIIIGYISLLNYRISIKFKYYSNTKKYRPNRVSCLFFSMVEMFSENIGVLMSINAFLDVNCIKKLGY